jgi:hypothetical protein
MLQNLELNSVKGGQPKLFWAVWRSRARRVAPGACATAADPAVGPARTSRPTGSMRYAQGLWTELHRLPPPLPSRHTPRAHRPWRADRATRPLASPPYPPHVVASLCPYHDQADVLTCVHHLPTRTAYLSTVRFPRACTRAAAGAMDVIDTELPCPLPIPVV